MTVIIVADNPSSLELEPQAGLGWCLWYLTSRANGISKTAFMARAERRSLVAEGQRKTAEACRVAARRIAPALAGRKVVLIGSAVHAAFSSMTRERTPRSTWIELPTISNEWWLDPENVAAAQTMLGNAFPHEDKR